MTKMHMIPMIRKIVLEVLKFAPATGLFMTPTQVVVN